MFRNKLFILILGFYLFSIFEGNSPAVAQNPVVSEQDTTSKQKILTQEKFANLSAEFQEKERNLGYKEGDFVEMRQDSGRTYVILPLGQEKMTGEQMREKLFGLITEKIANKIIDDIKIESVISPDNGKLSYKVFLRFETLQKELQNQAKDLGFKIGKTVVIQVDAVSWGYKVVPKGEEHFGGHVIEVIPSKEPDGLPKYRMSTEFSALPKDLKKRALSLGYDKIDWVEFIYNNETNEYELIIPRIKFGLFSSFEKLSENEKNKALQLGYKEGDAVLKNLFPNGIFNVTGEIQVKAIRGRDGHLKMSINTTDMFELVPVEQAKLRPIVEVKYLFIEQKHVMGTMQNIFIFQCTSRLEDLGAATQQLAIKNGYKIGDVVAFDYYPKSGQIEFWKN